MFASLTMTAPQAMQISGFNVRWLHGGSCSDCTMAALGRGANGWFAALETFAINLLSGMPP